jgi:hypothetical protein
MECYTKGAGEFTGNYQFYQSIRLITATFSFYRPLSNFNGHFQPDIGHFPILTATSPDITATSTE